MRRTHRYGCLPRGLHAGSFWMILVLAALAFPPPARPADEPRTEPAELPLADDADDDPDRGDEGPAEALETLLSAAVRARGGLDRLRGIRDEISLTRIVYGDVYKAEVICKTWRMEPHFFREDMTRDGVILSSRQYDGRDFLEGYGGRVRFGLKKDLDAFLENAELNRIFSLLPINTGACPARLGNRVLQDGAWLREVAVTTSAGLTCKLLFDEQTNLVTRLEYLERLQYADSQEVHPVVTLVDSYRTVDGVLVPDRLRIFSRDALKAEVRLIEHNLNVGLNEGFFSRDRLRKELEANAKRRGGVKTTGPLEQEWKKSAYRKIAERLATHAACRFRRVASYGDPKRYHDRLFKSGLSLVVDPGSLQDQDVLAFYAEILPGPEGFYEDSIVLARPPPSASVSGELLLHEATHALLCRGRESEPLAVADDEYLSYYQAGLFAVGSLLESFERIALGGKQGQDPRNAQEAKRVWQAAERRLQQSLRDNHMTEEALRQFRDWCGVDFDLHRIRRRYLGLGVDPEWMPMGSEEPGEQGGASGARFSAPL